MGKIRVNVSCQLESEIYWCSDGRLLSQQKEIQMRQRQQIEEVNSINNHHNQQLPSFSQSKVSSMQRLDSHIKSTLGYLQGKKDKKYLHVKLHNSLQNESDDQYKDLIGLLRDQFDDKLQLKFFKQTKELLNENYDDNELHYIIVPEKHLSWAETFARQEREESDNKKKIYVFGILKKNIYTDKVKARSKKKLDKNPDYIEYFYFGQDEYPLKICQLMEQHLDLRIRQEGNHVKTWALTNKFADKKVKKRTLHFYYEASMEKELTGMYKTYKKKSKSSWIQIYQYITFEDVLRKIRDREIAVNKQIEVAKRVTSKISQSQSVLDAVSMKSGFLDGATSQINSSILSSSIRAINRLDQNDVNIIICHSHHPQLQKFRALVRAQKYGNWFLWQIDQGSSQFLGQLKGFLKEQQEKNKEVEAEEYQKIIHSKNLFILAHNTDYNTIEMFRAQRNVLHNMELLQFGDHEQFSLLLRESAKSFDDYVIAVVPGGYRSYTQEYARIITEFEAKYKNIKTADSLENVKFISNANGRHVSHIGSSNLLGTQSNMTSYYEEKDNGFLETIMKQRDRHFHPFEGLKGYNVYLLIKETIHELLDGIREYVSNSPRIHISTYIDREFLKRQIETITLKDSAIVITDDTTLREAQAVTRQFNEVCILNITDREKVKEEVKVISSGPKDMIYQLIKEIPEINDELEDQDYQQKTKDLSFLRKNRILPKKINFRPGDTIAIRLPSKLKDEQSRKMQIRLQKFFNKQIKIEYYKEPKDIRLVNKLEEPLSFIIWADDSTTSEESKRRAYQLQFFKELSKNQIEQLREQFIIYSPQAQKFEYLTVEPAYERFKFASSRWQRIEQYIIGTYKRFINSDESSEEYIYNDEMIRVFFNDKDKASKDLISTISKRRDGNDLNAANHIQFHIMEDMQTVLAEQSPFHKYYVIFNEETSKILKSDLLKVMNNPEFRHLYFKIISIQQEKAKKIQASDDKVRKVVPSETAAGEWLCGIKVLSAEFDYVIPHVIMDRNSLDYYYFLDKYSRITRRFTYNFSATKQQLKKEVLSRKDKPVDQIWIIVKDLKIINEYHKYLQKCQNFKNVRFILQSNDQTANNRPKIVFKNEQKKQIQKFLLNIYRRDKRIFFPSSIGEVGSVALIIMNGPNNRQIPINRLETTNWEDILKAKVFTAKDIPKVTEFLKSMTNSMVYLVYPNNYEKQTTQLCNTYKNLKRIAMVPFPEYDPRRLSMNFVENNNKIYIGTYPAEITDYLRMLRYNIRKSEDSLEKSIKNQLIEINIQKEYKLSDQQMTYLTAKNDSVIINKNGYELDELNSLLARSTRYNYLQIYVGDQQSGKVISDFNQKKKKDIKFIDVKASPLMYMKGESKSKNCMLQTNEQEELITYLYNLPENRYEKAVNNRGKLVIYVNSNDSNLKRYIEDLRKVKERNPKIIVNEYSDINKISSTVKEPGVILIHNQSQKEYLQKVKPMNNINYFIVGEDYNADKNYANYGNKYFVSKQAKQFENFMNQLVTNYSANMEPIALNFDQSNSILNSIQKYNSRPILNNFLDLKFCPTMQPKLNEQTDQIVAVELKAGVIDANPPSLLKINFPKADLPSLPLGIEVLKKIKDNIIRSENPILKPGVDTPPSRNWFNIRSDPDSSANLPKSIALPRPAPIYKSKLAILHPSTPQFNQIGQVLKKNLEPDQFLVTIIPFKSEHELEEYSKNNGQRLNGYDKIVVFLSNIYRKYDANLKQMKSKLNNRMEYFIFDDNFHTNNHGALKSHLRPYKIKKYALPYADNQSIRYLNNSPKIVILVPANLIKKYQHLKGGHISVVQYINDSEINPYIHKQSCFVIIVCMKENYHDLKLYSKVSPRCKLVIDTQKDLPEDQLYLFRINSYSMYYGADPPEYLKSVLPQKPAHPLVEELKYLFFGPAEEDLVFQYDYEEYEKIPFKEWKELYGLVLFPYRNKNNWLIKNSPGKPELVHLNPKVYLETKDYMKDFKNNFTERGYLNEEKVARKSTLVIHEFADLPEAYYTDDKDLAKQLEKQQAPSVVLYNSSNLKLSPIRLKYVRHKWIGITDNDERWIDSEGILPEVTDEKLKRKQDMFTNMFNSRVFDQFNDMQYYYLSNKANVDHNRNIFFRTKEQLLAIFQQETNLLMVVFVQAKDINHIPQALLAQGSEQNGMVKLILLKIEFVDDYDTLYIKFNEIDPVIKHINAVEAAGRIDFIVYNEGDGERSRQTLILRRQLKNFENKPYNNFIDIEQIARNIKGRYKKVFVICFPDERSEIESIFNNYSIQNKGIVNEGVEFILIDRLSTIKPNPSHISNIRIANNPNIYSNSKLQTPPRADKSQGKDANKLLKPDGGRDGSPIRSGGLNDSPVNNVNSSNTNNQNTGYSGSHPTGNSNNSKSNTYSNNGSSNGAGANYKPLFEGDVEIPSSQSIIKPAMKMDNILANKNFVLNIDEKLKGLFPVGKFFANKVNYFTNPNNIPEAEKGVAQLVISTQANPEIISLSEEPQTLVVVVGKNGQNLKEDSNALVIAEDEIPGLIKRLEGSNVEDELNNIRNIDEYSKVRVVYDKDMDSDSKRRLLAASQKNKKILPTMYKGVGKLRQYMQEPDSLLLLMMSYDPENLEATVAQQNKMIVKKKKVKMIVPRKSESDIDGLETILEQEEVEQENEAIKNLTDEQVDIYLKIYENTEGERPPLSQSDEWEDRQRQNEREEGEGADLDNITKLNVHSNIRPENIFREDEIQKIKQRLTGDLIVLIIDSAKKGQVDEAINKYNVLVQSYTNSMNLENDIRDRKDNVTLAVIDRNMLDKIAPIKKKYPHAAFILESDSPHDEGIEQYRPYLAGQIKKMSDLQKIVAELNQQNERIRYNAESIRAASRFDMKKTSIVDVSNNQRFTVGLSNQKSKKAFLFYKQPENNHVKVKLSDTFNNISYIPYKSVADFKRLIGTYNTYSSILIANGNDIPELEDFVSKKKQMIYVIRFNPPADLRDNPKVKKLFSTFKRDDLEKFIFDEFQKNSLALSYENSLDNKYKSNKNVQGKRYIQKYEPNTFGTTPRFPGDFVPPKSKQSTYSRKYMKSTSRSKLSSRLQAISPKSPRNMDYFQT